MSGRIGDLLRTLRLERELTLAEVAGRVGVGIPYICDLELGRRPCSPHTAARLADALEVPRERLVGIVLQALVEHLGLTVSVQRSTGVAILALALSACVPPERSLVRCRGTASIYDTDVGVIAWVSPADHGHSIIACDLPDSGFCVALSSRSCTVERLP